MQKADYEVIETGPHQSFALREFRLPQFDSPWHFHPEIELTWIRAGTGRRFVGDHIAEYGPGDLVLLGSNLAHVWISDPPTKPRPFSHSLVIQFLPQFAGQEFWLLPEWRSVSKLFDHAVRGLLIQGAVRQDTIARLQRMVDQRAPERLISLFQILDQLSHSTDLVPLASPGFIAPLDDHAGERINRCVKYVHHHLSGEVSLPGAARAAGMSPAAFSRYFKRIMGKTFTQFVNEVRIGNVCRLLIESDASITETAYQSGYTNLSNFNRRFLDLRGMPPRAYRALHGYSIVSTNRPGRAPASTA